MLREKNDAHACGSLLTGLVDESASVDELLKILERPCEIVSR